MLSQSPIVSPLEFSAFYLSTRYLPDFASDDTLQGYMFSFARLLLHVEEVVCVAVHTIFDITVLELGSGPNSNYSASRVLSESHWPWVKI